MDPKKTEKPKEITIKEIDSNSSSEEEKGKGKEKGKENEKEKEKEEFNWPPLESDPEIFNDYFHKVGLAKNVHFTEMLGLDEDMIKMIPDPIIAVLLAYQSKDSGIAKKKEMIFTTADYFMDQTSELDNCCGLIAGLHAVYNNPKTSKLVTGSILESLFAKVSKGTPAQRAEEVEKCQELKTIHKLFSEEVRILSGAEQFVR